jgi:hypothetical protein
MANSFHSKPISTLHLAWAAGFIEGEGSFSSAGRQSACVTAAQVQKEPIERLQALFGGRVVHRHTSGHSSKPIWVWSLTARRSIEVMMTLYVLMSPRRQGQIEAALAMWKAQKRILRPHGSTHCGAGHELADGNVYLTKNGHVQCAECKRVAKRARRERLRAGFEVRPKLSRSQQVGELNPFARLTDAEVEEIKRLMANGAFGTVVAKTYGVTPTLIYMIKNGKHRAG